ncbi:hypothetical protein AAMO2058_000371700 [Amorphochlora amoebiformis]
MEAVPFEELFAHPQFKSIPQSPNNGVISARRNIKSAYNSSRARSSKKYSSHSRKHLKRAPKSSFDADRQDNMFQKELKSAAFTVRKELIDAIREYGLYNDAEKVKRFLLTVKRKLQHPNGADFVSTVATDLMRQLLSDTVYGKPLLSFLTTKRKEPQGFDMTGKRIITGSQALDVYHDWVREERKRRSDSIQEIREEKKRVLLTNEILLDRFDTRELDRGPFDPMKSAPQRNIAPRIQRSVSSAPRLGLSGLPPGEEKESHLLNYMGPLANSSHTMNRKTNETFAEEDLKQDTKELLGHTILNSTTISSGSARRRDEEIPLWKSLFEALERKATKTKPDTVTFSAIRCLLFRVDAGAASGLGENQMLPMWYRRVMSGTAGRQSNDDIRAFLMDTIEGVDDGDGKYDSVDFGEFVVTLLRMAHDALIENFNHIGLKPFNLVRFLVLMFNGMVTDKESETITKKCPRWLKISPSEFRKRYIGFEDFVDIWCKSTIDRVSSQHAMAARFTLIKSLRFISEYLNDPNHTIGEILKSLENTRYEGDLRVMPRKDAPDRSELFRVIFYKCIRRKLASKGNIKGWKLRSDSISRQKVQGCINKTTFSLYVGHPLTSLLRGCLKSLIAANEDSPGAGVDAMGWRQCCIEIMKKAFQSIEKRYPQGLDDDSFMSLLHSFKPKATSSNALYRDTGVDVVRKAFRAAKKATRHLQSARALSRQHIVGYEVFESTCLRIWGEEAKKRKHLSVVHGFLVFAIAIASDEAALVKVIAKNDRR